MTEPVVDCDILELACRRWPELNLALLAGVMCDPMGNPVGLAFASHHATAQGGVEPDEAELRLRLTAIPGLRLLLDDARKALPTVDLGEGRADVLLAEKSDLRLWVGQDAYQRRVWFLGDQDRQRLVWWVDAEVDGIDVLSTLLDEAELELRFLRSAIVHGTVTVN